MIPNHIQLDSRIAADQAILASRPLVVSPQPYWPAQIRPAAVSAATLSWGVVASGPAIVVEHL